MKATKTELNLINKYYDSLDEFKKDAQAYCKALEQGRVLYNVEYVSKSGMKRVISVRASEKVKGENRYFYRNFYSLFMASGEKFDRNYNGFIVGGCGMNMCFALNYYFIMHLKNLGVITKKRAEVLAQKIQ